MNPSYRLPSPQLPRELKVALMNVEQLHGYQPECYVGLVHAVGCTPHEAIHELEEHAVEHARRNHAEAVGEHVPSAGVYVVLGLRITGGISSSGQPEWLAYGTLTRGYRSFTLMPADADVAPARSAPTQAPGAPARARPRSAARS